MKRLLLFILIALPFISLTKQTSPSIKLTGVILDEQTIEPLPFVTIQILQNEILVFETMSDFDGQFIAEVTQEGQYEVRFSSVGFQSEKHLNVPIKGTPIPGFMEVFLDPTGVFLEEHSCHEDCNCVHYELRTIEAPNFQYTTLTGKITDSETGEPLPFVKIIVERNGVQVIGGQTDFDGNYIVRPLEAGEYVVKTSYVGFEAAQQKVSVENGLIASWDFQLKSNSDFKSNLVVTCCWRLAYFQPAEPIIDLFAEQDSINDSIQSILPSTIFAKSQIEVGLKMFPNPTSSVINISRIPEIEEMWLADLSGKIVKTIIVNDRKSLSLDLTSFSSGIYFLKYLDGDQSYVSRIIKE